MDFQSEYSRWLNMVDGNEKALLSSITNDERKDCFYSELKFGTAGLRGILGLGINRINKYTIARATQGLAQYILSRKLTTPSVVICFDSRYHSQEFAQLSAQVLAANNIKVYLFKELRPVAYLSFAVRYFNSAAGIMITASHNPSNYNGYKVYGSDGGQISLKAAEQVMKHIAQIDYFGIQQADYSTAVSNGAISLIGDEIDHEYINTILKLRIRPDVVAEMADKMSIVYTPIHGTGNKPVADILKAMGFRNVYIVKEQAEPDPDFSTVKSPNPEYNETLTMAIDYAKRTGASFALGTDPDCDRVGVAVNNGKGDFISLTGNQIGCILLHYILSQKQQTNTLPSKAIVIKTIVSTQMANAIAQDFGVKLIDVLTGFKFIGEKIYEFEQSSLYEFLFGFEESYGYLIGTHVRDKDAVVACMMIAEAAAFYAQRGMTLYDALNELYAKYGYFAEETTQVVYEGIEGASTMKALMEKLRRIGYIEKIDNVRVHQYRDYLSGIGLDSDNREFDLELPQSDVIYYQLEDMQFICVRPSGTEPKIKLYYAVKADSPKASDIRLSNIKTAFNKIMQEEL